VNGSNATVLPPPVRNARNLRWVGPTLVILFAAVLMALAAHLVREPATVDQVTVVNPVEQGVDVDVKEPGGSWLPLAAIEPKSTTTVDDVYDVGGSWIIRYSTSGEVFSEVRRSHDDLEHAHWRLTVPTRARSSTAP
jgi:hypothetical protein